MFSAKGSVGALHSRDWTFPSLFLLLRNKSHLAVRPAARLAPSCSCSWAFSTLFSPPLTLISPSYLTQGKGSVELQPQWEQRLHIGLPYLIRPHIYQSREEVWLAGKRTSHVAASEVFRPSDWRGQSGNSSGVSYLTYRHDCLELFGSENCSWRSGH